MCRTEEFVDLAMDDRLEDMIRDVGAKSFVEVVYENMSNDAWLCYILIQLSLHDNKKC